MSSREVIQKCVDDRCNNINTNALGERECIVYAVPELQWRPMRACPMSNEACDRATRRAYEKEIASRQRNRPGQQKGTRDGKRAAMVTIRRKR